MRNLISVAFFLSILAQTFQPAFASDISSPKLNYFNLSGEIQNGDAEKVARAFLVAYPFALQLTLDSPSGNVEEAVRIASLVKALHMTTVAAGGATCASSCFFIFLAGDTRLATGTIDGKMYSGSLGFIGLHRPYMKSNPANKGGSTEAVSRQHEVMKATSEYLRNQDISQHLIDLMMSRPSNDIYWMTDEDIEQLGSYSPGMEELLISRCGYSRKFIDEVSTERSSKNAEVAAHGLQRMKAFAECSYTAFPDLNEESLSATARLRKGWRPWLKQKVASKKQ